MAARAIQNDHETEPRIVVDTNARARSAKGGAKKSMGHRRGRADLSVCITDSPDPLSHQYRLHVPAMYGDLPILDDTIITTTYKVFV